MICSANYSSSTTCPLWATYIPSKNLRMSLFFTAQDWLIRAHVLDTFSTSLPEMRISVLFLASRSMVTPSSAFTLNFTFWPMKFTTSREHLSPAICTLVGKWAYTIFIRYWNPRWTPVKRFWMWLQTVLMMASSFDEPNHFSTMIVLSSFLYKSTDMCLKLLVREPRGPFT